MFDIQNPPPYRAGWRKEDNYGEFLDKWLEKQSPFEPKKVDSKENKD